MKRLKGILLALILLFVLSGCGGSSYIDFQGSKYRVGGAHSSNLGSVGLVRTEFNNIYEPQFTPSWKGFKLAKVASYYETKTNEYNITGKVSNKVSLDGGVEGYKKEEGIRYIFEIKDKDGLIRQINLDSKLKKRLHDNKNWRIVTSIVTIQDHNLSKRIRGHSEMDWKLKGTDMIAKSNIDSNRKVVINISDGVIVGYQYSRICWKDRNASLLIVDRPGIDVFACPDGTELVK